MSNLFMFAPLHSRDDKPSAVVALSDHGRYLRLRTNTVAARAQYEKIHAAVMRRAVVSNSSPTRPVSHSIPAISRHFGEQLAYPALPKVDTDQCGLDGATKPGLNLAS
jgi:hypothetical protein